MEVLLEHGADVNAQHSNGFTPFLFALNTYGVLTHALHQNR